MPLDIRERVLLLVVTAAIVIAGIFPAPLVSAIAETARDHAARVNPPGPLEIVERMRPERPREDALARSLLDFREKPGSWSP